MATRDEDPQQLSLDVLWAAIDTEIKERTDEPVRSPGPPALADAPVRAVRPDRGPGDVLHRPGRADRAADPAAVDGPGWAGPGGRDLPGQGGPAQHGPGERRE